MALPAGQSPTARISLAPMILPAASCTCSTSRGQKYSRAPPVVVGAAVDVVEHHALGEQPVERLIDLDQAQVAHHLGPKARIQQVQDGVFYAADVLVHAAAASGL